MPAPTLWTAQRVFLGTARPIPLAIERDARPRQTSPEQLKARVRAAIKNGAANLSVTQPVTSVALAERDLGNLYPKRIGA